MSTLGDASDEPTAPLEGGGSWYGNTFDVRSSDRNSSTPDVMYFNVGFRVARTPL